MKQKHREHEDNQKQNLRIILPLALILSLVAVALPASPVQAAVLTVTTNAATSVEATTATLNGEVTNDVGETIQYYGFVWGTSDEGDPGNVDPSGPAGAWTSGWKSLSGDYGVNPFSHAVASLPTGTTIYFRAAASGNVSGWAYGAAASFLTKPAAPTGVGATNGLHTDKVVVTWTRSTGATGYYVYQDGVDVSGLLGDVATYDDTTAGAPTITPGTASATDGTSTTVVTLSLAGESASNGTTHTYKVVAHNDTGNSVDSGTDTGYRGVGPLSYQWYRSADDSDGGYSAIAGATTNPYNDTDAPADGSGRYYYCELSATGATSQNTTSDRGYRAAAPSVTTNAASGITTTSATLNGNLDNLGTAVSCNVTFEWGTTSGGPYPNETTLETMNATGPFSFNLGGLAQGTTYYFRAKADGGVHGTSFGAERSVITSGTSYPVSSATGTGTATFSSNLGNITGLTAVAEGTLPTAGKPSVSFPQGLFSFNITGIAPGATVTITLTFPSNMSTGTQY